MTIEAEFYTHRQGKERFNGKSLIEPGSTRIIEYLNPTKILVILNIDNTRGEIIVKRPGRVMAVKYRDEDDERGDIVDPSKPIEIKSGQDVLLMRKARKKPLKETYFSLEPNDDIYEKVPNPDDQTSIIV